MLEKFSEAVFGYCFAILNGFAAFIKRTHGVVVVGVPSLIIVAVDLFLPRWVGTGILAFVILPAAAALFTMIIHGLLLSRRP